jgi:hypothetical protein
MSEKKLAYDFWNTPEGIKSQKMFDMRDRIRRLEASNAALLDALDDLIDECGQAEDCGLIDWEVMGKAREIAHKMRGASNE